MKNIGIIAMAMAMNGVRPARPVKPAKATPAKAILPVNMNLSATMVATTRASEVAPSAAMVLTTPPSGEYLTKKFFDLIIAMTIAAPYGIKVIAGSTTAAQPVSGRAKVARAISPKAVSLIQRRSDWR